MWSLEGTWPEVTATSEALAEPAQKCEALWILPHVSRLQGGPWSGLGAPSPRPFPPVPPHSASQNLLSKWDAFGAGLYLSLALMLYLV